MQDFIFAAKSDSIFSVFIFFKRPLLSLEALSETLSCAGQARFNRVLAELQYPCDFGYAGFLDVLEDQNFAVLGPELCQGALEFLIRARVGWRRAVGYRGRAHKAGAARVGADE
jgi:hypothetical protein